MVMDRMYVVGFIDAANDRERSVDAQGITPARALLGLSANNIYRGLFMDSVVEKFVEVEDRLMRTAYCFWIVIP